MYGGSKPSIAVWWGWGVGEGNQYPKRPQAQFEQSTQLLPTRIPGKKKGQQNKSDRSVKCAAGTGPAPRTEPFPRGKLSVPLLVPPVLFIGGRSHISRLHSRALLAQ